MHVNQADLYVTPNSGEICCADTHALLADTFLQQPLAEQNLGGVDRKTFMAELERRLQPAANRLLTGAV